MLLELATGHLHDGQPGLPGGCVAVQGGMLQPLHHRIAG